MTAPNARPAADVSAPPSPLRRALPLVAIAALAIAAYANSFDADFTFDGVGGLRDNARVRDLGGFFDRPAAILSDNRWLGYLTFALDHAVHGVDVTGYHVVNLAIHVASALLVHALVLVAFATPRLRGSAAAAWRREIALVAAALFVAHPLQTQAVTYVVQRFTSLAALLYLLAVVQYGVWRVWREGGGRSAVRDAASWAGILAAALLAMRSKEIAFTLPIAAVAFEAVFFEGPARRRAAYLAPLLATLPIVPIGRIVSFGTPLDAGVMAVAEATRVQTALSRADYLATQLPVIATYLRLIVLPVGQNIDHDVPLRHSFLAPDVIACGALLLGLVALAGWLLWRTSRAPRPLDAAWRLVAFGVIWFFVALSVESSVIPIVDVLFEHRVYLPLAGLAPALATAAALLARGRPGGRRAFLAGGALVAVVLAGATFARNRVWQDEIALWGDAARKSPGKARVHQNLGAALAGAGRLEEAVQAFTAANRADPADVEVVNNLGAALRDMGRTDEAVRWLRLAVRGRPDLPDPHYNLGRALMDSPATAEEAVAMFEKAIALRPAHAPSYANLAATLNRLGRFEESVARLAPASAVIAESAEARFNLAVAYAMLPDPAGARRELAAVARLDPARAQQLAAFLERTAPR